MINSCFGHQFGDSFPTICSSCPCHVVSWLASNGPLSQNLGGKCGKKTCSNKPYIFAKSQPIIHVFPTNTNLDTSVRIEPCDGREKSTFVSERRTRNFELEGKEGAKRGVREKHERRSLAIYSRLVESSCFPASLTSGQFCFFSSPYS